MCGIAGIIGNSNKETVQAMLTETAHRGPDDHGIYSDEECTLGHNRLSIIDLSNAGHQPMISADKRYVMVFNGEIFNYKIKRKILTDKGIHFNTKTDSEVLLQLFIMYKEKCLEHLEGMYAFAIWDTKEKTLFCARDKFGIKPLYYKNIEGTFLFCSEIKGLLKVDRSSRICEDSMFAFLMFGDNFSPSTFVKNIHSLKAGHYLIYKQGKISCSKFNKPADHNLPPPKTYEEAKADVKSLVISSVREQLVSDVPLGLFLSGGLDSNIIAYVATQLLGENKINSYTISHDGIGNEGVMAEETARFYNTIHNEYRIGNNDVALEFDSFITSIDQPTYNGINNYFVSKYSKKDITVALSGLGGDELFFGYNWQFNLMQEYNPNDKWAKLMGMLLPIIPSKLDKLYFKSLHISKSADFNVLYSLTNNFFTDSELNSLSKSKQVFLWNIRKMLIEKQLKSGVGIGDTLSEKIHISDCSTFMGARLREGDSTSMKHALELRFPFLNTNLFEYVNRLPDSMRLPNNIHFNVSTAKFNDSIYKKLLYDSFKNDLPPDFGKRKKTGFFIPHDNWMKNCLKERIEDTLSSTQTLLDKQSIRTEYSSFLSGKSPWNRIWSIFVLLEWSNRYKISL